MEGLGAKVPEIIAVLLPERVIQVVVGVQVPLDLGGHRLLGGERAAGDEALHEEGSGDDDQHHGDRLEQPVADEAEHA